MPQSMSLTGSSFMAFIGWSEPDVALLRVAGGRESKQVEETRCW
jgi:hypothetical protein